MAKPATACLIGVDGYGGVHYVDLLRQYSRGTVQILGATVINEPEVPEKCKRLRSIGCQLFTDYRQMLDCLGARTDICFIPTGIHLHAPMTIDALHAGANVFVEKPAAATIQDVRHMQRCEQEAGRFVAVGYQTMYAKETLWMKSAILDGRIGELESIKCRGLWPRNDAYYQRNNWAGRLRRGGTWILDSPFNNAIAHQLNLICFLAGTDLEHTAELDTIEAELYRARPIEAPDTACLRIMTQTGVPLYFFVTHSSRDTIDPEIIVQGTRGRIRCTLTHVQLEEPGKQTSLVCGTHQEMRDHLMAKVLRRLCDPSEFICGLDIASAQTLCVNGAHDSSPVHSIPERQIIQKPDGNSIKTMVEGLDEIINHAFETEKLFSELEVPWAQKGRIISLSEYDHFPSCIPATTQNCVM